MECYEPVNNQANQQTLKLLDCDSRSAAVGARNAPLGWTEVMSTQQSGPRVGLRPFQNSAASTALVPRLFCVERPSQRRCSSAASTSPWAMAMLVIVAPETPSTSALRYPIPYRCFYSRNIDNLFMAGRCISVTHQSLGTTRVQKTCGMIGEAVGHAATICVQKKCDPRKVYERYWPEMEALLNLPGETRLPDKAANRN